MCVYIYIQYLPCKKHAQKDPRELDALFNEGAATASFVAFEAQTNAEM